MCIDGFVNKLITQYAKIDLSLNKKIKRARNIERKNKYLLASSKYSECAEIARMNAFHLKTFKELSEFYNIFFDFDIDREIQFLKRKECYLRYKIAKILLGIHDVCRYENTGWACIRYAICKFHTMSYLSLQERVAYRTLGSYSEKDSPFYNLKKLLRKGISIFDEKSSELLSKNDFKNAFAFLGILGQLFLHEIYFGQEINDNLLYSNREIGKIFYQAGESFSRAENVIKNKLISDVSWNVTLLLGFMISDIQNKIFNIGNIQLSPYQLAVNCFEKARDISYVTKERRFYLLSKDKLSYLKKENEDFEFILNNEIIQICREFSTTKPPFLKYENSKNKIMEESIRDYFLSHIRLVIDWIAVSEEPRILGRSDISIQRKDEIGIRCGIVEFKIWGRFNYLTVINQLRSYLTFFENFGIIIMINANKKSIIEKYKRLIIGGDRFFINGSLREEQLRDTNFTYFESKHYINNSRNQTIKIHHFIIDVDHLL